MYTKILGGTTYTVTQEAKPVGASGKHDRLQRHETSAQTAANFQISSKSPGRRRSTAKRPRRRAGRA